MINTRLPPIALIVLLFAPVLDAVAMDVLQEIKICARTENPALRSECYENLGKRVLANESLEPTPAGESGPDRSASAEGKSGGLPEDLGGSSFSNKAGNEQPEVRGVVTSCIKGADRRWFFIFEKGQIWKQVSDERLRYDDCNFEVTIVKDFFGYKMQVDGERRKIRIRRHR